MIHGPGKTIKNKPGKVSYSPARPGGDSESEASDDS